MPWTTIELGEVQIEPGKPRYPLKDGVAPWERMNFSAASSSSLVVTPGRAFERSIRRQRAWIEPAAAMASICSEVLRMIMPRYMIRSRSNLHLLLAAEGGEHGVNALLDLVGRRLALDVVEDAVLLVVVDHRLGLLAVLVEPVPDHLRFVVVAHDQLAAIDVTDAFHLRRIELDVEDVALRLAGAPAAQAAKDLVLGDVDQDGGGDLPPQLFHLRVEGLRLGKRAREAVENEAVGCLLALNPLG